MAFKTLGNVEGIACIDPFILIMRKSPCPGSTWGVTYGVWCSIRMIWLLVLILKFDMPLFKSYPLLAFVRRFLPMLLLNSLVIHELISVISVAVLSFPASELEICNENLESPKCRLSSSQLGYI